MFKDNLLDGDKGKPKSKKIISNNIAKTLNPSLRRPVQDSVKDNHTNIGHQFSRTYEGDEGQNIFTFINNQAPSDLINSGKHILNEKSLSPLTQKISSIRGKINENCPSKGSRFNSALNNNIFLTMKNSLNAEEPIKRYLSMKNLIPFNNLAKKKFMFQQQIEEDPDQDTRKSHLKSKDNVFFAEFSGNSRQESQQNPFSTTSFKQRMSIQDKEGFSENRKFSNNDLQSKENSQRPRHNKMMSEKTIIKQIPENKSKSVRAVKTSRLNRTSINNSKIENILLTQNLIKLQKNNPRIYEGEFQERSSELSDSDNETNQEKIIQKGRDRINERFNGEKFITFNTLNQKSNRSKEELTSSPSRKYQDHHRKIYSKSNNKTQTMNNPHMSFKLTEEGFSKPNETNFIVNHFEGKLNTQKKKQNPTQGDRKDTKKKVFIFDEFSGEDNQVDNFLAFSAGRNKKENEELLQYNGNPPEELKVEVIDDWKADYKREISKNLAQIEVRNKSLRKISSYKKFKETKNKNSNEIPKEQEKQKEQKEGQDQVNQVGRMTNDWSDEKDILNLPLEINMKDDFTKIQLSSKVKKNIREDEVNPSKELEADTLLNIYKIGIENRNISFKNESREIKERLKTLESHERYLQNFDSHVSTSSVTYPGFITDAVNDVGNDQYYNVYTKNQKGLDKPSNEQATINNPPNEVKFLESKVSQNLKSQTKSQKVKKIEIMSAIDSHEDLEKETKEILKENKLIEISGLDESRIPINKCKKKKTLKSKEVREDVSYKSGLEGSIVSSIRSIKRKDSTHKSLKKKWMKKLKKNDSSLLFHSRKKEIPTLLNSYSRSFNKSQQLSKISDLLNEGSIKRTFTNRESTQDKEKSKRGIIADDRVMKLFLERQKQYGNKLENLEKRTEQSHNKLEQLSDLGIQIKGLLESVLQESQTSSLLSQKGFVSSQILDNRQILIKLEPMVEKFDKLTTEIKEGQVLQKYWLENLRKSSNDLEGFVKKDLLGQTRFSEFVQNQNSQTNKTFMSHADPLHSENNSLFQKKLVNESLHSGKSQKNSLLNKSHNQKSSRKQLIKNNKQQIAKYLRRNSENQNQKFQKKRKLSDNLGCHIPSDNFIRRKTIQKHHINSNQRDNSSSNTLSSNKQTDCVQNSKKRSDMIGQVDFGRLIPQNKVIEDNSKNLSVSSSKKSLKRPRRKTKGSVKKDFLEMEAQRKALRIKEDSFKKVKNKPSLNKQNFDQQDINIYHNIPNMNSSKNQSLPYLHSKERKGTDKNIYSHSETRDEIPAIDFGTNPYPLALNMHSKNSYVSEEIPNNEGLLMSPIYSEQNGRYYQEQMNHLENGRNFHVRKSSQNSFSKNERDQQSEDFQLEPVSREVKKIINTNLLKSRSKEELIQLNTDFIQRKMSKYTNQLMPSEIMNSEFSESESGYDTNGNYQSNSKSQLEQPKLPISDSMTPMMNSHMSNMSNMSNMVPWKNQLDYHHPQMNGPLYNPQMMRSPSQNYQMYPPNLPPQYPYYPNSNLYQKHPMMNTFDSNYNFQYNNATKVNQPPFRGAPSNTPPAKPKKKRRKKKKRKYVSEAPVQFNKLNKLNQQILKRRANNHRQGSMGQSTHSDFNPVKNQQTNNFQQESERPLDPKYQSHYYYNNHVSDKNSKF